MECGDPPGRLGAAQFESRDGQLQTRHPHVHRHDGGGLHQVSSVGGLQLEDVLHQVLFLLHLLKHLDDVAETNDTLGRVLVAVRLCVWKVMLN